jgi:hypothetical protein
VAVLVFSNMSLAASALKPVSVCEVLEDLSRYAGRTVVVVGRLSSNPIDGAWLSENGCRNKTEPGDPRWPYAIFLGCAEHAKRPPLVGKLMLDPQVLEVKLNQLRKTTPLGFTNVMQQSPSGKEFKTLRRKESWAAVYGRVAPTLRGNRGGFGSVRAKAELCAAESGTLDIKERQGQGETQGQEAVK